jgi:primosomal protein N' (replication factor Y)
MRSRQAYHAALGRFHSGEAAILVGTQMIAKGLDFPNVTLVGVVSADVGLHVPDFRAAERAFQLVAQVAGRTGRGPKGGRVVVQTYNPDHYGIAHAVRYTYEAFARQDLAFREPLHYPPFGRLVRLLVAGRDAAAVERRAEEIRQALVRDLPEGVAVLGPAPAPLARIQGRHRWHLLLKVPAARVLRRVADACRALAAGTGKTAVSVDVDPVSTL